MSKQTVWITGAGGLIGSHLVREAALVWREWKVIPLTRQQLDLADFEAVARRLAQDSPSLLIHCAALSRSPQCEKEPAFARKVNIEVTAFLAQLFAGRRMVFFSTDLVFNGSRGRYRETDTPDPLGVYARTKLEAERRVLDLPDHLIIRTSLNGGVSPTGDRGFNEALELAWREGRTTTLFLDEFRCPLPAPVTARATLELSFSNARGIFHVAGAERLSRFQIGQRVAARHPELNPHIEAGSIKDFKGSPRAADCSLDCAKAQALLSFKLPGLTEWLESNPDEMF